MPDHALHPETGARFLLERQAISEDGTRATYRAAIFTPTQRFEYALHLQAGASAELARSGAAADRALESKLVSIAKVMARAAATKQAAAGLVVWPQRVLRWRGPR